MASPFPDPALELPGSVCRSAESAGAVLLEEEVVSLFDQFRNRLLRYLQALGVNSHDGEEVVQEVFLALFQHLQQGKSRQNLRGWIFRVAHNLGLKQRGRNSEHTHHVAASSLAATHVDPGPNPEEQLLYNDRQERLRSVLDVLPEKDQWCLHLRAEGLRYREIAEILGVSLGMVSLMLARSLARLGRIE